MICEKCGKEFFEDWRKDKKTRKTPCRYCSRACCNSKYQSKDMNEARRNKLQKKEKKFCILCGIEVSKQNRSGMCIKCSHPTKYSSKQEKDAVRQKKYRNKKKELLVSIKGGKCERCGYNKSLRALEFHHIDPNKKDFNISTSNNINIEIIKEELGKCILVCANCHREIHEEIDNAHEDEQQSRHPVKVEKAGPAPVLGV